jgi:Fe2+ or Zn2+ uptake regulation protein
MTVDTSGAYGNGRVTPQRRLIAQTAASMPGAFSVEELDSAVRTADPATGVATVYRAVSAMLASGWLERVGERGGSALFARCDVGTRHHHHVVCDGCGRVEATACTVSSGPADESGGGFVITRHEVTLYGLCPACAADDAAGGRG